MPMNAYIMEARGKTYLVFGDDAVDAARRIPVSQREISVCHSIPCESTEAYLCNTKFGGVLLQHADGSNLGGEPYSRRYREEADHAAR